MTVCVSEREIERQREARHGRERGGSETVREATTAKKGETGSGCVRERTRARERGREREATR